MQLRTISILSALLLPLVAAPAIALGSSPVTATETAPKTTPTKPSEGAETQVPPKNPAPGTCTVDNSGAYYTCTTCTSPGGGVVTITCTPKVRAPLWG